MAEKNINITNLQEFSFEEGKPLQWYFAMIAILCIFIALVMAFCLFSLASTFPSLQPIWNKYSYMLVFIFVGILQAAVPIAAILMLWKSSKSKEQEHRCPKCGHALAAIKLDESIMGVFRKSLESLNKVENPEGNYFTYEKYKTHYKCKFCSYEWLFVKTRKL